MLIMTTPFICIIRLSLDLMNLGFGQFWCLLFEFVKGFFGLHVLIVAQKIVQVAAYGLTVPIKGFIRLFFGNPRINDQGVMITQTQVVALPFIRNPFNVQIFLN